MKRFSVKRPLALILSLLMILTSVSAILTASVLQTAAAAKIEHSIQIGTGNREPLRIGEGLSYRAKVEASFHSFGFSMPTWEKKDSKSTLYLYAWKGTYEATLAAEPIAKQVFDPMVDGHTNWVTFDPQPAGEYLFHIDSASYDAGVWSNTSPVGSKGFLYRDGKEQRGEPELSIRFTEAVEDPFGTCEPSQDMLNKVELYDTASGVVVYEMNQSVGVRVNTTVPFSGMEAKFGTYYRDDIEMTMSVYAWKGTFEKTVAEAPVGTGKTLLQDNQYAEIIFGKIPAGEYLFLIHDMSAAPALYSYETVSGFEGVIYTDGSTSEQALVYPYVRLHFTAETDDYYAPCSLDENLPDGNHKTPDPYVIPSDSLIYTHEVMPDTWVFTDGLGRVSLTNAEVGDPREDKTVSMFFWTWHNGRPTVINVNDAVEKYPEAARDYDHPVWTPSNFQGSWNEPIYGHYESNDQWVLRRQAELLANAGVDAVLTDNTNGAITHKTGYTALFEAWSDAMDDGVLTPKVSFMLPFAGGADTNTQMREMYMDFYRSGKYHKLWFYWNDKPVIMARKNAIQTTDNMGTEIFNFFTYRGGQSAYVVSKTEYGEWGWLSTYPQALYYANRDDHTKKLVEQMTVGVAMNHNYALGQLSAMSGNNVMGRSYTHDNQTRYETEGKEVSKWGYNFAEQFNYALETDPKMIFITGWNEWAMARIDGWPSGWASEVPNAFCDQFNDEYSRDLEPTKGALKDHYYYQLVNFVRQYKGVRPIPTPSASSTIDITKDNTQWSTVEPY